MLNEEKEKIQQLVEKYKFVVTSGKFKSYTEEETKKDFILPLFQILGWDIFDKKEVTAEESQSGGRVDYGFYLDERLKFYVEAKSLKSDLHREEYADQVIKYSWNKGATWAILTDFESLKVFNAQVIDRQLADKLFFEIPCERYIEWLDRLWLLSKEAFKDNLIDKEAEKFGKKLQRVSVNTLLYKDLNECRDILTHDLSQWNPKVDKDLLDEGVQKLLDRLLFLRVAEDRGLEPPTLIPLIRRWESKGGKEHLYQSMVEKFREFDEIYNSNLFSPHPFEKWEEYSGATEKVAKILYGKQGYYEYDFKAMPADVLGSVYENYLGYRLSQLQKGVSISKDAKKRKEQGIYYTPSFIVDYIVKNTLGPVLDKCKSIEDLKKIKVLDPACGSGSFLIKAMDLIYEKYKEFGNQGGIYTKLSILLDNIYGVDLDQQAVEIARLNLLLNTLEGRVKLPYLDKNIKNGNSLISGTDEELEKYFGKNFRDKKPFNWNEEFPEVFKQGGFDVIIGNPPYVRADSKDLGYPEFRKYLEECGKYKTLYEKWDLFIPFIERGLNLLNNKGNLGFIISDAICTSKYAFKLLDLIQNSYHVNSIDYFENMKIFEAGVNPVVFQISKIPIKRNVSKIIREGSFENIISEKEYSRNDFKKLGRQGFKKDYQEIKIKVSTVNLGNICYKSVGMVLNADEKIAKGEFKVDDLISNNKTKINTKPYIEAKDIEDYKIRRIRYLEWDTKRCPGKIRRKTFPELYEKPKLMVGSLTGGVYDDTGLLTHHGVINFVKYIDLNKVNNKSISTSIEKFNTFSRKELEQLSEKFNLKYLLAIINSKFANFYLNNNRRHRLENYFYPDDFRNLPIADISLQDQQKFIDLVDKMINLNHELKVFPENSNQWNSIKSAIEKTDIKINEEVYKLYDLTPEEIEIVENSSG